MKRTLIFEMTARIPFDEELDAIYDALSPEEQADKLREMHENGRQWLRDVTDDCADVTVNVYVSEEDGN